MGTITQARDGEANTAWICNFCFKVWRDCRDWKRNNTEIRNKYLGRDRKIIQNFSSRQFGTELQFESSCIQIRLCCFQHSFHATWIRIRKWYRDMLSPLKVPAEMCWVSIVVLFCFVLLIFLIYFISGRDSNLPL